MAASARGGDSEAPLHRHCEEQSDEAIHSILRGGMDCFAPLAMTGNLNRHSLERLPDQRRDPSRRRDHLVHDGETVGPFSANLRKSLKISNCRAFPLCRKMFYRTTQSATK